GVMKYFLKRFLNTFHLFCIPKIGHTRWMQVAIASMAKCTNGDVVFLSNCSNGFYHVGHFRSRDCCILQYRCWSESRYGGKGCSPCSGKRFSLLFCFGDRYAYSMMCLA